MNPITTEELNRVLELSEQIFKVRESSPYANEAEAYKKYEETANPKFVTQLITQYREALEVIAFYFERLQCAKETMIEAAEMLEEDYFENWDMAKELLDKEIFAVKCLVKKVQP